MTHVLGAGAVVFSPAGVVLLQHADGSWLFPKGHVEPGETLLETALREVAEETGLHVHCPHPDTPLVSRYTNPKGIAREVTYFVCTTENTAGLRAEPQFLQIKVVPVASVPAYLTHAADREIFAQALAVRRE